MASNHSFTSLPAWHTPTTGHFQDQAGSGERVRRAAAVRMGQVLQPLPNVQSPLAGLNAFQADVVHPFAQEVHRDVTRDALVGALSGALVGYAISRRVQNRRGRR
jgi:hypothetical protein